LRFRVSFWTISGRQSGRSRRIDIGWRPLPTLLARDIAPSAKLISDLADALRHDGCPALHDGGEIGQASA
jgi:hypothetical protein